MKIYVEYCNPNNYYFDIDCIVEDNPEDFEFVLSSYLEEHYTYAHTLYLTEEERRKAIDEAKKLMIKGTYIEIDVPDVKSDEPRSIEELHNVPMEKFTYEEARKYCDAITNCESCRFYNIFNCCCTLPFRL